MALRLITPPAVEPISLVEAKRHLRIDHDDHDNLIQSLIAAARSYIDGKDGWLGRSLVTQTWELVLDSFPTYEIQIPLPPLQSIVSIKYDNASGIETTLDPLQYYADDVSEPAWVVSGTSGWPSPIDAINAVRVRFICGYPSDSSSPSDLAANVPASIKAALLLHVGALYENAEELVVGQSVTRLPFGVEALLRQYRVCLGMA